LSLQKRGGESEEEGGVDGLKDAGLREREKRINKADRGIKERKQQGSRKVPLSDWAFGEGAQEVLGEG